MENHRPRSREKNVTGSSRKVEKRGSGLGGGPVGGASGQPRREAAPARQNPNRAGTRSGIAGKLIALLIVLLLGGGGGIAALFGGGSSGQDAGQTGQNSQTSQTSGGQTSGIDLSALLGSLGGGSVSSGWTGTNNTGRLDETVSGNAREKYVHLAGDGTDTVTLMVYMCGTDLESRSGMGTADLQEMLGASFGDNINLLIYTGGCSGWRNQQVSSSVNQIWQVKNGSPTCLQKDLGSVSMTDPSTLTDYIKWSVKNYPANRYGLIFWDHGGGSISGYGYDEKYPRSGSMDLPNIHKALGGGGVKFDFIGFDACLMATAETALIMAEHGDYLIASEETEPGVGWYYTDWLTALGKNPSMPTTTLGQLIADSFVDTCASKCPGQLTTLSVVDLAEFSATVPPVLSDFASSVSTLIQAKEYQQVSNARSGAREFARSSSIDQIDLVHLAQNLGTAEGEKLAKALLGAVKYNRTSSNMTNAYGVSIYFPYRKAANVDKAVSAYSQIGMGEEYSRCIQQFASLEVSGQAVSGGTSSPLPALLGSLTGNASGTEAISDLLGMFLQGGVGKISGLTDSNTGFLSDRALDSDEMAAYLAEHHFAGEDLAWDTSGENPILHLSEEQWSLVQDLELNMFYDDGEGFIDLGLDNVFEFDEEGNLLGVTDHTWLAINDQPVAYYHTATVDDGEHYTITGRVPVLYNDQRSELILVFDDEHPYGFVSGIQTVYDSQETDTIPKADIRPEEGDTLEFLCDYYSYDGEYLDSYLLGDPLTISEEGLTISNVPLEGTIRCTYRFTDLYHQHYWTPSMP